MSAEVLNEPEGTRTVQLSDRDGNVIMHFEKPVRWVALDPQTAMKLGETMARAGYKVLSGDTPTPQKTQVTDMIRVRLINRVAIMIRSFETRSPRPEPKHQATEIVDAVLRDAT